MSAPKKPKKRKTAAPQVAVPVPVAELQLFQQSGLLERCRTLWQYGQWHELIALDPEEIALDGDRAKLALLVAAAHSHTGEMATARKLAAQALAWAADRRVAARVLVSAAQNTLGRVALALAEADSAGAHFTAAITTVEPRADTGLLAQTRRLREATWMGLLPDAVGLLEDRIEALAGGAGDTRAGVEILRSEIEQLRHELTLSRPQPEAPAIVEQSPDSFRQSFAIYRNLSPERQQNFLYLDVKSLPRTGLHFMRDSFAEILLNNFSFCEWYTEPGCCRQMPCALTGYATETPDMPMLRMIKSHDFELSDPDFPVGGSLRRLIMIRDPLFILTSLWALDALYPNEDLLREHGILISQINFRHDSHVLKSAYRIIDASGSLPDAAQLDTWLQRQVRYISGFASKWGRHAEDAASGVELVRYHETPAKVLELLTGLHEELDVATRVRIEAFRRDRKQIFKERTDPFCSRSARIQDHLQQHADLFRAAAAQACAGDRSGMLAG